jgi:tetratricopeptide (TPR) repeat protein
MLAACTQVLNLGWRVGLPEDEIAAALDEGRVLAQRTGDVVAHVRLLATSAAARGVAGDVHGALAQHLEAARLAEDTGNRAVELIRFGAAYWRFLLGDLRAALADLDAGIAFMGDDPRLGMEILGFSPHAWARALRAVVLPCVGRAREANDERERPLALAREVRDDETLGWARSVHTYYAMVAGETEGVLEQAHQGWDVAERLGSTFSQVLALINLARAHNLRGEWVQAAPACERGLALGRARRIGGAFEGHILSLLAEAQLGLGDVEAARSTAQEAIMVSRRCGARLWELMGQLALARALLAADGPTTADAAAALDRALALTAETGAVSMEPIVRVALADLARARGDEVARTRELSQARRLFEAIGAPKRAAQLAATM